MYVVQAGETVESIAYRYQLNPEELVSLNPGIRDNIMAGLRINVRPGTVLSNDVRARASYAPAQQPRLVTEQGQRSTLSQTQTARPGEVIVKAAPVSKEIIIPQRNESIANAPSDAVITEIPATSWSDERVVVASGNVTEEIIPDTLEYEPVQSSRADMQTELQQYVGEWAWPTQGQVAREFAPGEVGGQGVDIAGVPGQDIRAAMGGMVVYSGRDLSGGGNLIIVRHDNNLMTTYSHADKLYVAEDDQVVAGDPIASLGWNAKRESVLRFEVRKDGNPLDPMKFLPLQ